MVPIEVGKVFVDRGLQDGVRGVEVAVGEVVAHAAICLWGARSLPGL